MILYEQIVKSEISFFSLARVKKHEKKLLLCYQALKCVNHAG